MPLRIVIASLCGVLAAVAAACASGDDGNGPRTPGAVPGDPSTYAAPGPYAVGVTTIEFHDATRETPPHDEYAGAADRTLTTEIWYPATGTATADETADAPVAPGPFPLVVFAHGFSSFRRQSASYARHLASHGYVVASPDFPTTHLSTPGGAQLAGVLDQPADVAFIADELLRLNGEPGQRFQGALDGRLGVSGHSLGGMTALLTAFGPARDSRVGAVVAFAAPGCFFNDGVFGETSVPVMHVAGSADLLVSMPSVRQTYEASNAPRFFVEVRGGDHLGFADFEIEDEAVVDSLRTGLLSRERSEDDALVIGERLGVDVSACEVGGVPGGGEKMANARQRELMRMLGAAFFDAYLRENQRARALLEDPALPAFPPELTVEFE